MSDNSEYQRIAKTHGRIQGAGGHGLGEGESPKEHRHSHEEACNWPGYADIKQCFPRSNRRLDADDRTECSNESWSGNEVGQCCVNAVFLGHNEVPQLMSEQDAHQG